MLIGCSCLSCTSTRYSLLHLDSMLSSSLLILAAALGANAQNLLDALQKFPELSNFTAFVTSQQSLQTSYFNNATLYPFTFLAPDNNAWGSLTAKYGDGLGTMSPQTLANILSYHTLATNLSKTDFENGGKAGITVPTYLDNGVNNNRTAGVALSARFAGGPKAQGQVVFVRSDSGSPSTFRLMNRQNGGQPTSSIRSGLSSNVGLKVIDSKDGVWNGGRFHIVTGILTPPTLCMTTIRGAGLSSLDNALNRTMLWNALDTTRNITCLGPNNAAFTAAGNADSALNTSTLSGALLFHTLPEVAYSDYLYDGQEFKSLQNMTVRVRIATDGKTKNIYFNNAKVIDANVL